MSDFNNPNGWSSQVDEEELAGLGMHVSDADTDSENDDEEDEEELEKENTEAEDDDEKDTTASPTETDELSRLDSLEKELDEDPLLDFIAEDEEE